MARRAAVPPPRPPVFSWPSLVGIAAALGAFLAPFPADDKFDRMKLEAVELWILAVGAAVVARAAFGRERGRPDRALAGTVTVWLLVNAALAAVSPDRALAVRDLLRTATAAAAFFAFAGTALTEIWESRFLAGWTVAAGLLSLYGILQHWGGVEVLLVPQYNRVLSTFGNPIFFAAYLVPSIFLGIVAWRRTGGFLRLSVGTALVAETAALALTQTRSADLALAGAAVAAAYFSGDKRLRILAVGAVCFAVVGVAAVGGRDQAHLLLWRDTIKVWRTSPLTGVGLGSFHLHLPDVAGEDLKAKWPRGEFVMNFAHNEYLQTLAEGGPAALAALLAVVGALLMLLRRREGSADAALIGAAALAGFVQNVASADFRFGVSEAMTFALMGLVAAGPPDDRVAPVNARAALRIPAGVGALVAIAVIAGARVSFYSAQRRAATAPGFFDGRVVDPAKAAADLESKAAGGGAADLENLALLYARQMKRPDGTLDEAMARKAIWAFTRAIEIDPSRASAHNNLANTLFTDGKSGPAAEEWRRAADLDPSFVDPRLNLGKTAYVRGDLKEATRWFQDVLKIDPGNAEASLFLRRMVE